MTNTAQQPITYKHSLMWLRLARTVWNYFYWYYITNSEQRLVLDAGLPHPSLVLVYPSPSLSVAT